MSEPGTAETAERTGDADRRGRVLDTALATFARFGYRKTSMEEVARTAAISRPGLYFLFASKEELFRAAVTQSLERDLEIAGRMLAADGRPVADRLLDAFDQWAGRYVGAAGRDIAAVIDDNLGLLGGITVTAPRRFAKLVEACITTSGAASAPAPASAIAQTLISTSVGIKYQVETRDAYLERLRVAIGLLVPSA